MNGKKRIPGGKKGAGAVPYGHAQGTVTRALRSEKCGAVASVRHEESKPRGLIA